MTVNEIILMYSFKIEIIYILLTLIKIFILRGRELLTTYAEVLVLIVKVY